MAVPFPQGPPCEGPPLRESQGSVNAPPGSCPRPNIRGHPKLIAGAGNRSGAFFYEDAVLTDGWMRPKQEGMVFRWNVQPAGERFAMSNRFTKIAVRVTALCVVGLGLASCGVNAVPTQDEQVKAAWSQVQNEYQRRADLIPNLVATVKGYAAHEENTFKEVTEARAKATQMVLPANILSNPQAFHQFEQNQAQLSGALGRLLAVSEAYPQLKADQNFLVLQAQLEGTENRIAVARRDYIAAVQQYNTTLRTIPSRWIAAVLYPNAKPYQTFTSSAADQTAPKVSF